MHARILISRLPLLLAAIALAGMSACNSSMSNIDRVAFDGIEFKTKAAATDKKVSRENFTVTVKRALQSLEGAKEAGRYEGIKYCIATFGSSKIVWTSGPDVENNQLVLDGDTLILQGICQKTW
ncbi:hypothetical protein [Falsiphaeobacter marinintestinus]|uniref:hypothetical protein n=1 Tax=Falsiphaeobacter marinintestinus TaxID=1492905 RepID=UPI0011B78861|nr:hypothetical protein [Phaeobacter marinintestinus]